MVLSTCLQGPIGNYSLFLVKRLGQVRLLPPALDGSNSQRYPETTTATKSTYPSIFLNQSTGCVMVARQHSPQGDLVLRHLLSNEP